MQHLGIVSKEQDSRYKHGQRRGLQMLLRRGVSGLGLEERVGVGQKKEGEGHSLPSSNGWQWAAGEPLGGAERAAEGERNSGQASN